MNEDINNNAIQIVLAGDFNTEQPDERQIEELKLVITELQKKYNIPNENVIPHRHASSTACPGENLMKMLWADLL